MEKEMEFPDSTRIWQWASHAEAPVTPRVKNKRGILQPICIDCKANPRIRDCKRCYECNLEHGKITGSRTEAYCNECRELAYPIRKGLCNACYARGVYTRKYGMKRKRRAEEESHSQRRAEEEESHTQGKKKKKRHEED